MKNDIDYFIEIHNIKNINLNEYNKSDIKEMNYLLNRYSNPESNNKKLFLILGHIYNYKRENFIRAKYYYKKAIRNNIYAIPYYKNMIEKIKSNYYSEVLNFIEKVIDYNYKKNYLKKNDYDYLKKNIININNYTKNEIYIMYLMIEKKDIIEMNNENIIETNNDRLIYFIALYHKYYLKSSFSKYNKYLLKAMELNNKDAIIHYALCMENLNEEIVEITEILEDEIYNKNGEKYTENEIIDEIYNKNGEKYTENEIMGIFEKKIELNKLKAIEIYKKEIELNNSEAMNYYGIYLYKKKDYNESKKYFIEALKYNNENAYFNYIELLNKKFKDMNSLELYKEISNTNSILVKELIIELERNYMVILYKNKIKNFSKILNCCICLENKICIPFHCMNDYFCKDCYAKIYKKKCPLCRYESIDNLYYEKYEKY